MNICHILPIENVLKVSQPMEMYLAQTLKDKPELCKTLADKNSFKILDNGCYELNSSIDIFDLLDIAESIQADEIVLPDVMFSCEETITRVINAIKLMHKRYDIIPFRLMAVIQGTELEDYEHCAQIFSQFKEISTIGVPKKFMRKSSNVFTDVGYAMARAAYANCLAKDYPNKDVHLLGLTWGIMELPYVANYVRSVDTNLIVEHVKRRRSVWDTWSPANSHYSFDTPLTDKDIETLIEYMGTVEGYVNGFDG